MSAIEIVVTGASDGAVPRAKPTLHQVRRLDRLSRLVLLAAQDAATTARLHELDGDRIGLVVGAALGCLEKTEAQLAGLLTHGLDHADPMGFPDSMDNAPAAHVAIALGCRGPSFTVSEREITGECAMILGTLLLHTGLADAVVVAAGDTASPGLARALEKLAPGVVPGESAAAVVLEAGAAAEARAAPVVGRLLGHARASAPGRTGPLRLAGPEVVRRAEAEALSLAMLASNDVVRIDPDGWCMGDGVLRAIRALERLAAGSGPVLIARGARGGGAAALLFGR